VSAHAVGSEPLRKGSKVSLTRKVGRGEQTMTSELTEFTPPKSYAFRVLDGPVRALGNGRFEPLDDGTRTRFTFELDFDGHGIGKLLVPLFVRRQAAKELPESHENLKKHRATPFDCAAVAPPAYRADQAWRRGSRDRGRRSLDARSGPYARRG
jgi:hypothetical protein